MSWVPISGPFPYLHEAFEYMETNWCHNCVFRKTDEESDATGPMCYEVEGKILLEDEPVEEIDRATGTPLRCNKYKFGDPTPLEVEGQEKLIDL